MGNCATTVPDTFDVVSPRDNRRSPAKPRPGARRAKPLAPPPEISPIERTAAAYVDTNPGDSWSSDDDRDPGPPLVTPARLAARVAAPAPASPRAAAVLADLPPHLGLCGIRNYGNFCFISTAVQCLAAAVPLTEYFLTGAWSGDVNETNMLGHGGQLAAASAKLVTSLWTGRAPIVKPLQFLQVLLDLRGADVFDDGGQHDLHEFLSFLMDGLHEDLNCAAGKAAWIYEPPLSPALLRTPRKMHDATRAAAAWHEYLQKNQSIIGMNHKYLYTCLLI